MSPVDVALVTVQREHKLAIQRGMPHLQSLLKAAIPEGWPQFPEAFALADVEPPGDATWPSYFFVCPSERCLVGNGGFAGSTTPDGEIEIGYEIAPQFRNRGFATAAVKEMINYAFSQRDVQAVVAHTLAEVNASNAVLKKVGMTLVAELPNEEVGSVWRWCLRRTT